MAHCKHESCGTAEKVFINAVKTYSNVPEDRIRALL